MSELEKAFRRFAIYGEMSTSGNEMTGMNFSKMLKECGVMDGEMVTSTDVDNIFNKYKYKGARNINYIEFQQALKELSGKRFKGKSPEEALHAIFKLMEGKEPDTLVSTTSVAERLTNTSKCTGSHKEHFCNTGKGLTGQVDVVDKGHVGAYKGSGTYDKTH
nr:PREDICTED: tubulin polymerization-promoting protein family member 2-like [Anolis carolinensis]|eukprot:XP_008114762.1 PREDICTED: tubulin polymerization-promoting protein family member 2-like [Anolis carolinensis]